MNKPRCSECAFFSWLTEKSGKCLYPEVPADMDATKCAGQVFRPREYEE